MAAFLLLLASKNQQKPFSEGPLKALSVFSLVVLPLAPPLKDCLLEGNNKTRTVKKPATEGSLAPLLLRLRAGFRGYWTRVPLQVFWLAL